MLFSSFFPLPLMTISEVVKCLSACSSSVSHTARHDFRAQTWPCSCPMSRERPEELLAGRTACKLPGSQLVSAAIWVLLSSHYMVSSDLAKYTDKSTGFTLGLPTAHANRQDCHHMSIWLEETSRSLYSNLLLKRQWLPVIKQVSCDCLANTWTLSKDGSSPNPSGDLSHGRIPSPASNLNLLSHNLWPLLFIIPSATNIIFSIDLQEIRGYYYIVLLPLGYARTLLLALPMGHSSQRRSPTPSCWMLMSTWHLSAGVTSICKQAL